ncbi:MAG: LamG-like jellyroll fold domain-containing protein [Verrucomicrobiota bacterium]
MSYYRFEEDLDADPFRLVSPSEVAGQPDLISLTARIDDSANPGSLPNTFVPFTGAPNTASLDGFGTSGNPDIDATIAYSAVLDVDEMTVEMWVRTEEQFGVLVSRSTTANVADSISDGYRIYSPNALTVEFYTIDAFGNIQLNTISTNIGLDNAGTRGDGNANWRHVAFSYDMALGEGILYLDSTPIGSALTTSGSSLYWGADADADDRIVQVGVGLDGYNFSKTNGDDGYVDELRFSGEALAEEDFLVGIPEPATSVLLLSLVAFAYTTVLRRK